MPTVDQLVRIGRKKLRSKTDSPALQGSPQKHGVCGASSLPPPDAQLGPPEGGPGAPDQSHRGDGLHPRSRAQPAGALDRAHRGGRVKDLPGVRYHIVRGTLDAVGVQGRKRGRSKYGAKRPKA